MKCPVYVCELVRQKNVNYTAGKLNSSQNAKRVIAELVRPILENSPQEQFLIVSCDTKLKPIGVHLVTIGTLDASLVHPREVFRHALLANASAIFLVHNHPSGDLTPSREDIAVTQRLKSAGELLGVQVLDHVIVGYDIENDSFNAIALSDNVNEPREPYATCEELERAVFTTAGGKMVRDEHEEYKSENALTVADLTALRTTIIFARFEAISDSWKKTCDELFSKIGRLRAELEHEQSAGNTVRDEREPYTTRFTDHPIITIDNYEHNVRQLLQDGDANTKLRKSSGYGYVTAGLSLAPHQSAGIGNLCPNASAGCIEACLDHQGLASIFTRIRKARLAKSIAWFTYRAWFINQLAEELERRLISATRASMRLAARLNVFSDIQWERHGIVNAFPTVEFYDYTKDPRRVGQVAENYWTTFSRSEQNENDCVNVLKSAGNVAVVFADCQLPYVGNRSYLQRLPRTWSGFTVVDGDTTDLRFEDIRGRKHGRVIGLRLKAHSLQERNQAIHSGFAVRWN